VDGGGELLGGTDAVLATGGLVVAFEPGALGADGVPVEVPVLEPVLESVEPVGVGLVGVPVEVPAPVAVELDVSVPTGVVLAVGVVELDPPVVVLGPPAPPLPEAACGVKPAPDCAGVRVAGGAGGVGTLGAVKRGAVDGAVTAGA
jgi:hypothetical protein